MELLSSAAPATVANFLAYVDSGAYRNLFVHRSATNFVVQTGGWTVPPLKSVPTFAPISNEFGLPNIRGTVAMAKAESNPNSATSQWFVSLADNSANLDQQNGGFTVFARVLGGGMSNVDRIAALPVYDIRGKLGADFSSVPLKDYRTNAANLDLTNIVTIRNVASLPDAISSDESAFVAQVTDGKLQVAFRAYPRNPVTVSVNFLDPSKNPQTVNIPVTGPNQKYIGLLQGTSGNSRALVSLALTPSGLFTGKLVSPRGTASIASSEFGQFVYTNANSGAFCRALAESFVLWYDHEAAAVRALSYSNTTNNFFSTLLGPIGSAAWSGAKGDTSPLAGRVVNAVLTHTNSGTPVLGFLQCTIDKSGGTKFSGRLSDNRPFAAASCLVRADADGRYPLPFAFFSGGTNGPGLTGDLQVWPAATAGRSVLSGVLDFVQGTNKSKFDVLGQFCAVRAGINILSGTSNVARCLLRIGPYGSDLPAAVEQEVLWGADNVPVLTNNTNGVTLRFDPKTGGFNGTMLMLSAAATKPVKRVFRGVVLPKNPPSSAPGFRGAGLLDGGSFSAPVSLLVQ